MTTTSMLRAVFWREVWQAQAEPADVLWHAFFFMLVASLFPLTVNPDAATLRLLAPGVLWVGALLAVLLAASRMFEADLSCGWVDQWLLACRRTGVPLALLVAAKWAAQWLVTAGAVLLAAPWVALQYGLGAWPLAVLMLSLLLGTGVLVLLAGVAAALAGGLRGAALLVLLIVLPLAAPSVVFGTLAVHGALREQSAVAELSVLGAMLALAALVCPVLAGVALRAAAES